MVRVAVLSTCSLNQWALDFQGNYERIIDSVRKAKAEGARYRCGPELDITGYGCGDHFLEMDTIHQSWRVVASLLQHPDCTDILIDVGLPVMHKHVVYNCKLVFCNRQVVLVRPKMRLANDSHMGYQETRWFTAWRKVRVVEELSLPSCITAITGQDTVPFGDAVIAARDTLIGIEICEELWYPESPHIAMGLDGVEIMSNGLGALEEHGSTDPCYSMVRMATFKSGGCYLFANNRSFDGSGGLYHGDSCIGFNGNLVSVVPKYSLLPVLVVTARVDLDAVATYKNAIRSRCDAAGNAPAYPKIQVDFWVCGGETATTLPQTLSQPVEPLVITPGQQALETPALWMWDFLRRSGRTGVLLPLSGDLASTTTAAILANMCHKLVQHAAEGHTQVVEEVQRLVGEKEYIPTDTRELCGRLVSSLHLPHPSHDRDTVDFTRDLAHQIGCNYKTASMDKEVTVFEESFNQALFNKSRGNKGLVGNAAGVKTEAWTNLQSRLHMALIYYIAELGWQHGGTGRDGPLLVLASRPSHDDSPSSHIKFGDSYGDINLVGSFTHHVLRQAIIYARTQLKLPIVTKLLDCIPATLEDTDEVASEMVWRDMLGPTSLTARLHQQNGGHTTLSQVEERVKGLYKTWGERSLENVGAAGVPTCYLSGNPPHPARPLVYPPQWASQVLSGGNLMEDEVVKDKTGQEDLKIKQQQH